MKCDKNTHLLKYQQNIFACRKLKKLKVQLNFECFFL